MKTVYRFTDHFYIISTVFFTVYSQIVMRWRVSLAGPLPELFFDKLEYVAMLLLNPWVISGVFATFLAGISWMLAMTKFELTYAFPFVSLNYVFILFFGHLLFNEQISIIKFSGCALVVLGIIVIAKG